ncbi:MAG: tRNA uracil 4-sulfurtransferase ThiI [Enterobacterales bacterium]
MKIIIKLFPEICVKSKSVRLKFISILVDNINLIFKKNKISVKILKLWDCIKININCYHKQYKIIKLLINIPGIHSILIVKESNWIDIEDIYKKVINHYFNILINKNFCVRVKRRGIHTFSSCDIERWIGKFICNNIMNTTVKLVNPEEIVSLEIIDNNILFIIATFKGIGGFPISTQGHVLSLISGGFDSGVSSYMLIRRGIVVHYCFFNLGGNIHETNVRKIAYYLWEKFSISHTVSFISLDFLPVINEILSKISESQVSIILKRLMIKVASIIAKNLNIKALVTGDVLGQVSSQTLINLDLINNVDNILILRPLITYNKEKIIQISRSIGTEIFSIKTPEYCGLFSNKSSAKSTQKRIEFEENKLNDSILTNVIKNAKVINIEKLKNINHQEPYASIKTTSYFKKNDILLDIRDIKKYKYNPVKFDNIKIQSLPFYKLNNKIKNLDKNKSYILYCDSGITSKLCANYLYSNGFKNIKIYKFNKINN